MTARPPSPPACPAAVSHPPIPLRARRCWLGALHVGARAIPSSQRTVPSHYLEHLSPLTREIQLRHSSPQKGSQCPRQLGSPRCSQGPQSRPGGQRLPPAAAN